MTNERYVKVLRKAAEYLHDAPKDSLKGCCHAIDDVLGNSNTCYWTPEAERFQDIHTPDVCELSEERGGYWFDNDAPESRDERLLLLLLTAEAIERGDLP